LELIARYGGTWLKSQLLETREEDCHLRPAWAKLARLFIKNKMKIIGQGE
jgi:hypothetical protein